MSPASVRFLGTGEAFDEGLPHTSLLLRSAGATLLLDCGALVPPRLLSHLPDPDAVDGIWLSHLHADHAFGLAGLLGRWWEDGRRAPLALLGARGTLAAAEHLLDLGYPGLRGRFAFAMHEVEVEPGASVRFGDLALRSAESNHSVRNLSVRVEAPAAAPLCYSGDGEPSEASAELGRGAAWVHECFSPERQVPSHATLARLERELAARAPVRLGLVHVSRGSREAVSRRAAELAGNGAPVSVPGPGDTWEL